MSKRGEPWSHDEEEMMLDGLRRGETFEHVARRHERSGKAIRLRFGMYCRKHMGKQSLDQLGKEFHQTAENIQTIISDLQSTHAQTQPPHYQQQQQAQVVVSSSHDEIKDKLQRHTKLLKKLIEEQSNTTRDIKRLEQLILQSLKKPK